MAAKDLRAPEETMSCLLLHLLSGPIFEVYGFLTLLCHAFTCTVSNKLYDKSMKNPIKRNRFMSSLSAIVCCLLPFNCFKMPALLELLFFRKLDWHQQTCQPKFIQTPDHMWLIGHSLWLSGIPHRFNLDTLPRGVWGLKAVPLVWSLSL